MADVSSRLVIYDLKTPLNANWYTELWMYFSDVHNFTGRVGPTLEQYWHPIRNRRLDFYSFYKKFHGKEFHDQVY